MSNTLIYNVKFIELIDKGLITCLDKYYKNCNLNCLDNYQHEYHYIRIDKYLKPHKNHISDPIFVYIRFNYDINVKAYTNLIKTHLVAYFESLEWYIEFAWYSAINKEYTGYEPLNNIILKIQIYDEIPTYKPLFRKRRNKKRSKNTAYQSWSHF